MAKRKKFTNKLSTKINTYNPSMQIKPITQIASILKNNQLYIGLLIFFTLIVYSTALPGQFSIVDDIPGIINSGIYNDLGSNLASLHLQKIIYSLIINFIGPIPLPFHIFSLTLHILNIILAFIMIHLLFGKQIAKIASLLFAIHPVNTEAVTWISGSPYLLNTLFFYPSIIAYYFYKKSRQKKYLFISLGFFTFILASTRTPSILTLPMALIIIDQFLLEKKLNLKGLFSNLWSFTIPIGIYIFTFLQKASLHRLATRTTGRYLNQQTLNPIGESYPYTIYSMLRLYIFPKDLVIYYDGKQLTRPMYIIMTIVTLIFIGLIIYAWKKHRRLAGLAMLTIIFLAPTMSPIKVTWFIAERYLYSGAIFYTTIIAILIIYFSKKYPRKYLTLAIVALIALPLSIRTVIRNLDYLDNKEFARRTIKTAPLSVRPYNDLGSLYLMDGDAETAMKYYRQALEINNRSRTSIHNIGLIYIVSGPQKINQLSKIDAPQTTPDDFKIFVQRAYVSLKNNSPTNAAYYAVEAMNIDPNNYLPYDIMGDVYIFTSKDKPQNLFFAQTEYKKSLQIDPEQPEINHKLGIIYYKLNDLDQAIKYMQLALEQKPDFEQAQKDLEKLQQIKKEKAKSSPDPNILDIYKLPSGTQ